MKTNRKRVEQKISKLAIASFTFGLISFLMVPIIGMLSIFTALTSILLGIISLIRIFKNPSLKGNWLCLIGIVLGISYFILLIYSYYWGKDFVMRIQSVYT